MVGAAAAEHGVFQRGTQPWQRFARVKHDDERRVNPDDSKED